MSTTTLAVPVSPAIPANVSTPTAEFTASKEFVAAVKLAVSATCTSRGRFVSIESVMFHFAGNEVTLWATDLQTYYQHTMFMAGVEVTQLFSVVVHRDTLKSIKPKSTMSISQTAVTVDGVTSRPCSDVADFPKFPWVASNSRVTVDATYFDDLAACAVSASDAEARPILTGIHHSGSRMVATDGLRLLAVSRQEDFTLPFTLPAGNAALLQKSFPDGASLVWDDNNAWYSHRGTRVICRLLDGSYPDTTRIMPTTAKTKVTIEAQPWIAAMRSAITTHNLATKKQRDKSYTVKISIQRDTAEVTATCGETGASFTDVLAIGITGEDLTIGCNANYLLDALRQVDTSGATLSFNGPVQPFLVEGGTRTALVAPIGKR